MGIKAEERGVTPQVMLLYVELTDPETGRETENRVALYNNGWLIAESYGTGTNSPLSRDDVEAMSYNLSRSLGVKDFSKHVSMRDDFEAGSFEWEFALNALREQEEKAAQGVVDEKLQRIMEGEAVVADDEWLDSVDLPSNATSIPNPDRVGLRDVYLVGKVDNPIIHEWRVKNGIVEPDAIPVKKPKLGM